MPPVTSVVDLTLMEAVQRYKSLVAIERGFHVLKGEIEIAPMFHPPLDRIRAHAVSSFIDLALHPRVRHQSAAFGRFRSPTSIKSTT